MAGSCERGLEHSGNELELGKFKLKRHCIGFLSYLWCRYAFHYRQNTCCCYQCHGSSVLTYMIFVFFIFNNFTFFLH